MHFIVAKEMECGKGRERLAWCCGTAVAGGGDHRRTDVLTESRWTPTHLGCTSPEARKETERGEEEGEESGGTATRGEPYPRCPGHWAAGGRPWTRPLSDVASPTDATPEARKGFPAGAVTLRLLQLFRKFYPRVSSTALRRRYNEPSFLPGIAFDQLASTKNITGSCVTEVTRDLGGGYKHRWLGEQRSSLL
ncbi:uncharacterized protein LOC142582568 [Dermacentor variabilis]|uniref:uncharacterized protein LOC142582568 n=1 Tax=Dermacentor variabilis TaxID=34621 RepID=UPI003F5C6953